MNWTKEQKEEALRLQREKVEGKKSKKKGPIFSQDTLNKFYESSGFGTSKARPKDKK